MDATTFLKREIDYTRLWGISIASLALWLAPKYLRSPLAWELASGVGATAAMLTAAYQVSRLEKQAMFERVQQAAQRDLFTSEVAMEVYLQQLKQQQTINEILDIAVPIQPQAVKTQVPVNQQIQPSAPNPMHQVATRSGSSSSGPGTEELDLEEAIHYPSIIVFGAQGSGKTTLARAIAQIKANNGHQIQVLDPHSSDWLFPAVGGGMNYEAIEQAVVEFVGEVKQRYHERDQGQTDFRPLTVVCEEFTNWSGRLEKEVAIDFLRTALCDICKIFMGTIFVVHANTIEGGLAGAKGLAQLRDAGCYQVELFAEIDPITKRPRPTGRGKLYRPGMPPVDITIPLLSPNGPLNNLNTPSEYAEYTANNTYSSFPQPYSDHSVIREQSIQGPFSWLEGEVFLKIMQAIVANQPKHKSIESILGFRAGANKNWQRASHDWDTVKQMMS